MARPKNIAIYDDTKSKLLKTGVALIRAKSYASVGINDILTTSGVPRGSFYHYFKSKENFGLAVADFYHDAQLESAKSVLRDTSNPPITQLFTFFHQASAEFTQREYADGCLMCNLTAELADTNILFQKTLQRHWSELTAEIALCIEKIDLTLLCLEHLSHKEAADWLLNAWSGAVIRMKSERSNAPLALFQKTIFKAI